MSEYRVDVVHVSTGKRADSITTRAASEDEARRNAEEKIRQLPTPDDLRVATVTYLASATIAATGTVTMKTEVVRADRSDLYDSDFLQWTEHQAELLRRMAAGEPMNEPLDWRNLAEEIEGVGAREKREVRQRLRSIFRHLLRWRYEPDRRSPWRRDKIYAQRQALLDLFEDSPSLRPFAARVLPSAFTNGRQDAEQETGALGIYDVCPWSFEQVILQDFLPDEQ